VNPETHRQQVLFLWLDGSHLDSRVVGWSFHDGAGRDADLEGAPPYATATAALRAGWRLLQVSPVPTRTPGAEFVTGPLPHEAVLERIVPVAPADV
jgi:hypothetical protein